WLAPGVFEGKARENRHAIVAAVIGHGPSESGVEAGSAGELAGDIHAPRAARAHIDLLQGHEIGLGPANDAGNPVEVEVTTQGGSVLDVIRENPQRCTLF